MAQPKLVLYVSPGFITYMNVIAVMAGRDTFCYMVIVRSFYLKMLSEAALNIQCL